MYASEAIVLKVAQHFERIRKLQRTLKGKQNLHDSFVYNAIGVLEISPDFMNTALGEGIGF